VVWCFAASRLDRPGVLQGSGIVKQDGQDGPDRVREERRAIAAVAVAITLGVSFNYYLFL